MSEIIIMSCYFGKLPEHFPAFCKSVERNEKIDFLLVTDAEVSDLPKNMKVFNISFEKAKERFQNLFDFDISLDKPYKLCDYKPLWLLAFKDQLEEYKFSGYCDLDMIFGDVLKFLPDKVFDEYDKIYELGHLTIFKNTSEVLDRYKLSGGVNYKEVFTSNNIFAFDEIAGMQNIYDKNNFPTYRSRDYADITYSRVQFILSYFRIAQYGISEEDNNYEKQLFYWEDGCIYRAYLKDGKINKDEFNYIHFSKRKMYLNGYDNWNAFFITNKGLFLKDGDVVESDFEKYNPYNEKEERVRDREIKKINRKQKIKYYWDIIKRKLKLK